MEDRTKRNLYAHILVELMRQIHPNMRDNQDYTNKLWDDLYIISGFELDVDSPFPPPSPEALGKKPLTVGYNQQNLMYRHYGRNIDLLLEKAINTESKEDKLAFVSYIFRLMRSFFNTWNKDNPEDHVLLGQLEQLSKGQLKEEIDYIRANGPIEAAPKDRNNSSQERNRGNSHQGQGNGAGGFKAQSGHNAERQGGNNNQGNSNRNRPNNKFSGRNNSGNNNNNNNRNNRKKPGI
ncbi:MULTISPECIES: DUF4290 domain-containing protein [Dyadobacter]|uniref:DUF4290 domain-containing protein n=1 Tax=Dyadobacter chenhuakuii TaxID=2909339 RepID=A0A9X1QG88_9BACT|nr:MULTISPECIES: DUF4290 domain-containing protein [Dyadobacter]MCE7069161.1 DUF4290 domain-containing protein [Dyadobacter sp. CY327]MCF2495309.1 DUF4290 domain-containing protein [Dyadobacter chenhuakuii]MCF2500354.1 DUF4290 domain-containing protein [Dyadobacter chenhuakuii]MCF2516109.1 DUF4290 domain-containing protein [Dyadobacter sp. CY351]USJ29349.1 DUF4290 domain-containing protein [Dyadobacter chenhuakuii]